MRWAVIWATTVLPSSTGMAFSRESGSPSRLICFEIIHHEGAGIGNPVAADAADFINTRRDVRGDFDGELIVHRRGLGGKLVRRVHFLRGSDARMQKLQFGNFIQVFPGDLHFDFAPGLPAWRENGREHRRRHLRVSGGHPSQTQNRNTRKQNEHILNEPSSLVLLLNARQLNFSFLQRIKRRLSV